MSTIYNPSPYFDPMLPFDYRDSLATAARVHADHHQQKEAINAKAAAEFDDASGQAAARAKEAREAGNRGAVQAQADRKNQANAAGAPTMAKVGTRGRRVHSSGEIYAARYGQD